MDVHKAVKRGYAKAMSDMLDLCKYSEREIRRMESKLRYVALCIATEIEKEQWNENN